MSGIVTYRSKLGDTLKAGAPFADVVLLDSPTAQSIPIMAPCNGVLFSITGHHFITKGDTIAMLATDEQQIKAGTQLAFWAPQGTIVNKLQVLVSGAGVNSKNLL